MLQNIFKFYEEDGCTLFQNFFKFFEEDVTEPYICDGPQAMLIMITRHSIQMDSATPVYNPSCIVLNIFITSSIRSL